MFNPIPESSYFVVREYTGLGEAPSFAGDIMASLDDAADQYVAAREENESAEVIHMTRDGVKLEASIVTDLACERIKTWHVARGQELPEWLEDELAIYRVTTAQPIAAE